MTIEEALKRNFTCTKIPGSPSIPPETCLARQEAAKEIRNKWRYPHCVDCDQGREIKIRFEKGESMGSPGRITCWCCERENQSFKKKIDDHRVCGFCCGHLSRALGAGVPIEEAKEEIKAVAQNLIPGHWPEADSWSWNKKPEETKPAIMPCMNSECKYFKAEHENNCDLYTVIGECGDYSTTPPAKPAEEKHQENVAIKHVDIPDDVKLTDPKIIESIPAITKETVDKFNSKNLLKDLKLQLIECPDDIVICMADEQEMSAWFHALPASVKRIYVAEIKNFIERLKVEDERESEAA